MGYKFTREKFHRIICGVRQVVVAEFHQFHTTEQAIVTLGERSVIKLLNSAIRRRAINRAVMKAIRKAKGEKG